MNPSNSDKKIKEDFAEIIGLSRRDAILQLLRKVERPGMDRLITFLDEKTDFFTAPASTKYHLARRGGLAEHSFNVYINFSQKCLKWKAGISSDSIILISILHDICKCGAYIPTSTGNFSYAPGKMKKGHGTLSVERIKKFIALEPVEEACIKFHLGTFGLKETDNKYQEYTLDEMHQAIKKFRIVQLFASSDMECAIYEEVTDKPKIATEETVFAFIKENQKCTTEDIIDVFGEAGEGYLTILSKRGDIFQISPAKWSVL